MIFLNVSIGNVHTKLSHEFHFGSYESTVNDVQIEHYEILKNKSHKNMVHDTK